MPPSLLNYEINSSSKPKRTTGFFLHCCSYTICTHSLCRLQPDLSQYLFTCDKFVKVHGLSAAGAVQTYKKKVNSKVIV